MAAPSALTVIREPVQAAALLHKTRRTLLAQLSEPESAAGLARRLGLPRQRVNYHLRELEREGLIECVEQRRKGNCVERLVRATARAFVISAEALGAMGITAGDAGDRFSAGHLMAAAANAIRDVASLEARARDAGKRLPTLTVDTEIRFATAERRAAFADELTDVVAALAAKYHDERAAGGRRYRLLALAHPVDASRKTR
jgi:DNA-binding transcriptional ArsR family regulator